MRLIDADALKRVWRMGTDCDTCERDYFKECQFKDYSREEICFMLEEAPTIDAVPVVRCKDCKYAHLTYDGDCKYCQLDIDRDYTDATYRPGNWYCADGERRSE